MTNEELYNKAMDAIRELFADTSVPQAETERNLDALMNEIEIMFDTLDATKDEN